MAGKGDTPRAVNGDRFRRNFEMVFPTKTKRPRMSDLTITIKGSSWARATRERDEAREALREIQAADWKTAGELRGMARMALEAAK